MKQFFKIRLFSLNVGAFTSPDYAWDTIMDTLKNATKMDLYIYQITGKKFTEFLKKFGFCGVVYPKSMIER
jgi:hypothetical protein